MAPVWKSMHTTAYCNCGKCCCWEYGLLLGPEHYLALRKQAPFVKVKRKKKKSNARTKSYFLDRYWTATSLCGDVYEGTTAIGEYPRQARPGPLNKRSLRRPVRLLARTLFAPWFLLGRQGTIAADLSFYPFGTRMYVPSYGWGKVEDCGGAIKGPERLDLYFNRHSEALKWGVQKTPVKIIKPGEAWVDRQKWLIPPLRGSIQLVDGFINCIFS